MQNAESIPSLSEKRTIKYPPPCKIVNNVVIGEETAIRRECVGLGELLLEKLRSNPDIVGQIDSLTDQRTTFAEINERSIRCALWLKSHGVQRDDVVGVATHNHLDSTIPLLGCLYIGTLFYPMHYQLNLEDSRYFIGLTKPKVIFVNAEMAETMAQAAKEENLTVELITFGNVPGYRSFSEIIERQDDAAIDNFRCTPISNPDEVALLVCSSGSTGMCKATMISHCALINNMLHDDSSMKEEGRVVMWFSSFRWISGTLLPIRTIYFGQTWIICSLYEEELTCRLIEKYNVEWLLLQSALAVGVLKNGYLHKYRLPSLKKLILGGAFMRPHLHEAMIRALPDTEVLFTYGTSEVCGVCTLQRQGDKIGSSGYVLKNTQLKVIDPIDSSGMYPLGPNQVGELLWKSPYVMTGYYENLQATRETLDKNGWIHSGDLGYYDEDGEVYICDRIKEVIKVRGCFVYPTEIENVLQGHPAVREVAVVRMRSDIDDEHPIAFVSKISGRQVTAEELMQLVADNLEDHKHLRGGVHFLDEIPHTDTGKIARRRLREIAANFVRDCVLVECIQND